MGTRSQHPPAPLLRVTSLVPPRSGRPSPDTRYFANLRRQRRCLTTMPANDGDTYTQIASRRPLFGSKLPLEDGIALDGAFPALGFRAAEPLWRRVRDEVDERRNLHRFASPGELRRKPGLPARAVQREPPLPRAFVHRLESKRFPSFDGSRGLLPGPLPGSTSGVSAHPSNRQATDSSLCLATRGVESGEHSAETRRMRA